MAEELQTRHFFVTRSYVVEVYVPPDMPGDKGRDLAIAATYQDDLGDYHALGWDPNPIDGEDGIMPVREMSEEGVPGYDFRIESQDPEATFIVTTSRSSEGLVGNLS